MVTLLIKPLNTLQYDYTGRANHSDDSGCDLYVQETTICPAGKVTMLKYNIACEMIEKIFISPDLSYHYDANGVMEDIVSVPYLLVPRSSISKTPLRMANSVGIIDKTYRGEIMSAVDNISNEDYTIEAGTRLFQIVRPSLESFDVRITDKLSETIRGTGGFGSTGV